MLDIVLLLFFFSIVAAIVGFAATVMILFLRKEYSNFFFLRLFLLSLTVISIYSMFLISSVFKQFTDLYLYLYLIMKAFVFLVAPSAFLYVRSVLFSEKSLKRYDWIHFMPFLIYFTLIFLVWIGKFIDIQVFNSLLVNDNGLFWMLSLIVWLLYAFCQTMMILNYDLKISEDDFGRIGALSWIRIYNLMILLLFSTIFVRYFLTNKIDRISCYILLSSVLAFIIAWFYFKPKIFYDKNKTKAISEVNDVAENFDFEDQSKQIIIKKDETKNSLSLAKEWRTEKKK